MSASVTTHLVKETKQAILLGLSRAPLAGDNPLTTLSLVAMRGRFARPHRPTGPAEKSTLYRPSPQYLPDRSRSLMLRLLLDRSANRNDALAVGILDAINLRQLKLHPFDYARLEDFIAQHADELGPEERAWLRIVRPERKQDDVYLDAPLTDEMLAQASKAQKLQFLRTRRGGDLGKARELIEALLPDEPAHVRSELVGLLAVRLSEADRPFLESLSEDRAQSVRDVAGALLSRIRGTKAFDDRIGRLKDHLQLKTDGIIRKHQVLKYTGPKPKSDADLAAAQRTLVVDLPLRDIAVALETSEEDLLEAASRSQKIGILPFLLLVQAVKDGLIECARRHVSLLDGDDGALMVELLAEALPLATAGQRDNVLRLAVRPASWTSVLSIVAMNRMSELIRGPLPHDVACELLDALYRTQIVNDVALDWAAPLIPRSLSEKFAEKSESVARRATLYHQFLLSLPEHEM